MTVAGLPPAARSVHRAITALVASAEAQDVAALREACAQLRDCDEVQVRDVQQALVLGLVEQAFPDGLDADDVRGLLSDVIRSAVAWLPDLDPDAVALVLTGTLSVHEAGAPTPTGPDALPTGCALVVRHLLHQLDASLEPELTRTFDELRTAQTMEMP